ncbi:zinc ABC transporter substrate-binding protein [uncultured Muribaculum sp.]|uniref:metal ABC transporter solute-binding protein, Zn/Mn family n=1 Tax=uncultured Muribaculum sp. TaxID=1918613 RepID=UPI00262B97EC|nr:zinc ABC transporter substrate-binding protein [uncultured Muribaculum sp.]
MTYVDCRRMACLLIVSALLIPVALLPGCIGHPENKPTVTVSIQPQKYMLEQIVGDKWDVKCLLGNGANPESYDPSMTHLLNLEKSKAYMRIGNIPFESAIINKVNNNNPGLRLYDTSEGVALIKGTHARDGASAEADEIDPHTWTSVRNVKKIASNMYEAMVEIDPANKGYYSRRFRTFLRSLDSLDTAVDSILAPCRGDAFMVWHPSLSYFARDYGLRQIALSPEGKEMSVEDVGRAVEAARRDSVRVMFFQKEADSRQAQTVNAQIGSEVVEINPLDYDWKGEMLNIAKAIAAGHRHE